MLDGFVQIEIGHPIGFDGGHRAETIAFEEIGCVAYGATVEGALAAGRLEMTVSAAVHALVGGHAQPNDLIRLTDGEQSDPADVE